MDKQWYQIQHNALAGLRYAEQRASGQREKKEVHSLWKEKEEGTGNTEMWEKACCVRNV